jgi:uncharacterized protein YndB with AHSA1/START domain
MQKPTKITIETLVHAPIEKVWKLWTTPKHINAWNNASPDWTTKNAKNDLKVGGKFSCRMEAKDGSTGFDFNGVYDEVVSLEWIAYTIGDRKVEIAFADEGGKTRITETFDPETENPVEMQKQGWQAILENFKKYTEAAK